MKLRRRAEEFGRCRGTSGSLFKYLEGRVATQYGILLYGRGLEEADHKKAPAIRWRSQEYLLSHPNAANKWDASYVPGRNNHRRTSEWRAEFA